MKLGGLDDRLDFLLALQMTLGAKTAFRSERALSTHLLVGICLEASQVHKRTSGNVRVAVDQQWVEKVLFGRGPLIPGPIRKGGSADASSLGDVVNSPICSLANCPNRTTTTTAETAPRLVLIQLLLNADRNSSSSPKADY